MPDFWDRQFSQVKAGNKPALTIDEMQERDKPELALSDSNVEKQVDTGAADVGKAAVSGVLGWGESVAEAAAKPGFTAEQQQQVIEEGYSPESVAVLDANKNILELVAEKGREWFGQNKEAVRESMSVNAKKALEAELINENLSFTDDAAKLSTWIMKGTETLSRMVPDLVLGGMGSKQIYNQTFEMMFKKGVEKGLSQEAAKIAADKAAKGAMSATTAQMATISATGGTGVQVRETIENTPWNELTKSETFKANFSAIDQDPQYEGVSDKEKLNLARTMTAEQAATNVQQDPALLAVNAASSFLGDATLGRIIQGRIGGGITEKAIKGFAAEAPTESGQGAMEQYAQNMVLIDVAGADIDPTKGVARAALEGAVLGGAIGGGVGGATGVAEKVTGREQVIDMPEDPTATAVEPEAAPVEPEVQKTVAERREELDEKLRGQRVTSGLGDVQEALARDRAPTVDDLLAEARTQPAIEPEAEVQTEAQPKTVAERREAMNQRLESQRAEYESKRIEAGEGEVQSRLSRPAAPSVEELIAKAPAETGPTPGELEFRSQQNREYLEGVKTAKIPQAMRNKPGATRLLNKGYRKAMEDIGSLAGKMSGKKELSPEVDTMTKAIEKLGGLQRDLSEAEGMDPASFKRNRLFPATGGMTFDHAAEVLNEQGYKNREGGRLSANDVVDMVYGEANNNERHLSSYADADMLTADADMVRQWSDEIGGTDKLNTAITKALNGEKLGKRQAEIVGEVLDTINAIRSDDVDLAKQELQSRREEREQRRVDEFNKAYQELTEVDESALYDYERYAESFGEMPDHFTDQQELLSELVSNAGDRDYQATEQLITDYDNGDVSLPSLLDQLSEIASRETTYEQAKPSIQTVSEPAPQRVERSDEARTEAVEPAPAVEPAAEPTVEPTATAEPEQRVEPEPTAPDGLEQAKQLDPDSNELTPSVDNVYDLVSTASRENPDLDYAMAIKKFGLAKKLSQLQDGKSSSEWLKESGGVKKLKEVFYSERGVDQGLTDKKAKDIVSGNEDTGIQFSKQAKSDPNSDPIYSEIQEAIYSEVGESTLYDGDTFNYDAYDSAVYDAEENVSDGAYEFWTDGGWNAMVQAYLSKGDRNKFLDLHKSVKVYHGSPDSDLSNLELRSNSMAFVSQDVASAKEYVKGGTLYETVINPKNPFIIKTSEVTYDMESNTEIPNALREEGFDSIISLDGGDIVILDESILTNKLYDFGEMPDVESAKPKAEPKEVKGKAETKPEVKADAAVSDSVKSVKGELTNAEVVSKIGTLVNNKDRFVKSFESGNSKDELVAMLGAIGQLNKRKRKSVLAEMYYEKLVNDTLGGAGLSLASLGEEKFKERAKILAKEYVQEKDSNAEDDAQFSQNSRTTGTPKGVQIKEAEMLANQFLKKYKGAAGAKVKVFATQSEALAYGGIDLPEDVRVNAYRIPQTGEIVLIAENLDNARDVWQKLRHEILAHHGLYNLVGESEWRKIMNLVSQSRESGELKEVWDQIDANYPELREDLKAEEVIAHVAEYEPGQLGEFADRIISAVIRALRNIGLINPGMMQVEIRDLIRVVGQRIKSLDSANGSIRNDVMFSKEVAEPSGFSIPDETRKDRFLRGIADKYRRLKVVQESVKEQGGRITEGEDVYLAEELFHGKIGEDMRTMEADYIKPLQDVMIEKNVDAQELDLYLIARHAPERNAHIAKINPKMQDGGSGMTNAEASEVMSRFESEGKTADMEAAAAYVDKMLKSTRQRLIDSGLETVDAVESWDSAYKFYVPLKGFANNEVDTEGNSVKPTGRGFSIRGKETMKAMGRRTMAESPVAYAISDATQSMMRARKNEVGQTLLRLVDANHDPELWQVFSDENPDIIRRITKQRDPVTGKMRDQVIDAPAPMFALKDQYLGVKMNGEQYYIKLNDVRLMEAMSNLGVEQANLLTKTLGRVTRMLSALITSYNPEFALSNLARDIQTAMYNVLAESEVKGGKAEGAKGLASQIAKDVASGRSFKALKKGLRDNNFEGEWGKYFKEYLDSGAKTGYFVQKEIEEIKNDIQKSIAKTGPGAVNALLRSKDKVIKFVDDYNDVIENASRLSVYVNARKQGFTEKQAASLAKNLTVNFNRRGEMTNNLNAIYMFFNASVQGTMNMLRAVATPKDKSKSMFNPSFYNTTQKIAMMLPIATMMAGALNRSIGGEDDDGKAFYDKVPDFVKETNFVLMIPGSEGDYIKIPMPYGYNFFASVGLAVDKSINGDQTAIESGFDLVSAFAGAFNPLGITDSEEGSVQAVKMASPSVMKPFVEMATNENFYGGPLYKQQNPFGLKLPDSYNAQRRTWELAKGVSEWLNDATGGNEFKSGYVDIAPESFQHLLSFMGGGLGTLVGRTQDLAAKGIKGEVIEDKDVPFWRKYFGNISDSVDVSEMYERFDSVKEAQRQLEGLPKKEALKYRANNKGLIRLIPLQKTINKELTKLNKRRREIESSKLSDERKKVIVDNIEEKKRLLASKFNKKYNDLVGE